MTSIIPIAEATVDTWTALVPMPTARQQLGVATVDGKIFAIGGRNDWISRHLGINEMYDPSTDTWVEKAPMPTPRIDFAIAVYENKIYVIGGEINLPRGNGEWEICSTNEVYDPATDTWETKASMPSPRSALAASVVDGKIYLMGGATFGSDWSDLNQVYDTKKETWTSAKPVPTGIDGAAGASLSGIDPKI